MPHVVPSPKIVDVPRGYQAIATERSIEDLATLGSCLVVMPTGGGKTRVMGDTLRHERETTPFFRAMVVQHTGELLGDNMETVGATLSDLGVTVSVVKAQQNDWDGDIIFACTATAAREDRAIEIPFLTHLVFDEAHRAGTHGALAIIAAAREINPDVKLMGYTATPNRGDGRSILELFLGVSYQITYAELIDAGWIVPPSTLTISLGEEVEAGLDAAGDMADDVDQRTLGILMNKAVHNQAVLEHWLEHASDRQTIGFCTTVRHAQDMADTFRGHGIVAEAVWGTMPENLRGEILNRYAEGSIQVVFNCMMLVEGYDDPRTSCIIGLRRFQEELTFLQALGRGLRSLDPAKFPGESKTDCVFLDFTGAARRHKSLELRVQDEREAMIRSANEAHAEPEDNVIRLPRARTLRHFAMTPYQLAAQPNQEIVVLPWINGAVASNRDAWCGMFLHEAQWHVVARRGAGDPFRITVGDRLEAVSAIDAFLAAEPSGRMTRDEREERPDDAVLRTLRRFLIDEPESRSTRYRAICHLNAARARMSIRRLLDAPVARLRMAA